MVYTIVVHLYAKDDADCIEKLKAKLVEASQVYSQDRETLSWFVMQDVGDKRKFTIVERYLQESSQKYHLENPYWKTFDPYVNPLLAAPMDLRRLEELDTGAVGAGAHYHEEALRQETSVGTMYKDAA
ncbi:Nn.00g106010.m01.CDS01 [Neocucurbitaria sp. VM-36]